MLLDALLPKLSQVKKLGGNEFSAVCPAHEDKHPSLTLKQADDRILIDCKAGCTPKAVVSALGLTLADLFTNSTPQIVETYSYENEDGEELFQVVRYQPKSFKQRHKDSSGQWVWNLENTRRVLWRLPELLKEEGTIYFVEGEKDASKLWEWGQVATTSPGGANNWKPEYANYLSGKRVVVIPDKDEAGFNYARQVIKSLQGKAREVKCIILPGDNVKDFSDWIIDNDISRLPLLENDPAVILNPELPHYKLEEDYIIWHKNIGGQLLSFKGEELRQERTGIHARITISFDFLILAWSALNIERSEDRTRLANLASGGLKLKDYTKEHLRKDLDLFCSGLWDFRLSTFTPQMLSGETELSAPHFYLFPYIMEGGGTILFAPPGRGKSGTAILWAQSINNGVSNLWKVNKAPVLYINLERSAKSIRNRLASINKILKLPVERALLVLNARGKSLYDIAPIVRKTVKQQDIKLVILDSISRAGFGDLTENKPVNSIIDTLNGLCNCWLALGHTPRASDEHVFGGIHFDAGADIVVQLRSQISTNGTMGIGYEIVKANDLPHYKQEVFAFEFSDFAMSDVRKAKPFEFPDIEAKAQTNMLDTIMDYISNLDAGDATATQVEAATGFTRPSISKVLNHSDHFTKTKRTKEGQFFGVKDVFPSLP